MSVAGASSVPRDSSVGDMRALGRTTRSVSPKQLQPYDGLLSNALSTVHDQFDSPSSLQQSAVCRNPRAHLHRNGIALPDLDNPTIAAESEVLRTNATTIEAARLIAAAGLQLAALTMPPKDYVFEVAFGVTALHHLNTCLLTPTRLPTRPTWQPRFGLHADKIAEKSHIDGGKLARIMRHLAFHHVHREVGPDTFAKNRLSATLDTKKPVAEVFSGPDNKHTGTSEAFPTAAAWTLGLWAKAACNLWETLRDPEAGFSNEAIDNTWHRTLGIDVPFYRWFEQPPQRKLRTLFGIAIKGDFPFRRQCAYLNFRSFKASPWASLPEGAVAIDVGGGIGSAALLFAQKHPHLRIIVQDLSEVATNAQKSWEVQFPEVNQSDQVAFEGHDFFKPQPVHNASIFFLRYIVHNWSDPYAQKNPYAPARRGHPRHNPGHR
ncbi:O-methyltransferase-domain-containing protein [Mycena leptocephala]|nr:O-methyltransferase-domain-containing protein [Mycena leptocephala]